MIAASGNSQSPRKDRFGLVLGEPLAPKSSGLSELNRYAGTGLAVSFLFDTAQPNSVLSPDRSLSFTVLAETGFPMRGLIVARR